MARGPADCHVCFTTCVELGSVEHGYTFSGIADARYVSLHRHNGVFAQSKKDATSTSCSYRHHWHCGSVSHLVFVWDLRVLVV
jgi:hypothetical protein